MRCYIAALFLLTLCLVFVTGGKAEEGDEDRQEFAQKAADAIDNTLLQIKKGISSFLDDSAKLTSFFNNVTDRFKKFTQAESEKADKVQ